MGGVMSEDPTRSDGPPITMHELDVATARAAELRAEGRVNVSRAIDLQEHREEPSPATRAAERDLEAVRAAQRVLDGDLGPISVPEYSGGVVRAPEPGQRRRRPIDDAVWEGDQVRIPIPVWVEGGDFIRYEVEPCPSWMSRGTYRWLHARLKQGMEEHPEAPLDRLHAWTARHVWVVTQPPKLVSSAGAGDLIGVALELAREVKRRGLPLDSLARPRRRRLLDSW